MASRLKIDFSVRAAVAVGRPFEPWGRTFSDAGVARDEISALRAGAEPLVLRVSARGGRVAERSIVAADWICDAGGMEPRRVPTTRWSYSREAARWASGRAWVDAWEECADARWMLHACRDVDLRRLTLAACACARTALRAVPLGDRRPRRAIEAAEACARGGVPIDESLADAATEAGHRAREHGDHAALHAALAAADAADVASCASHPPSRSEAARSAASAAWHAAMCDEVGFRVAQTIAGAALDGDVVVRAGSWSLRRMADLVRAELPTLEVLRGVTSG